MQTLTSTRANTSAATSATTTASPNHRRLRRFSRRATKANRPIASSVRKDGHHSRRKITATCTSAPTARTQIQNECQANHKSSPTKMLFNKAKTTLTTLPQTSNPIMHQTASTTAITYQYLRTLKPNKNTEATTECNNNKSQKVNLIISR